MSDDKLLNSEVDKLENEVSELSKMLIREQRKSQELVSTVQYIIALVADKLSLSGFNDVSEFIDVFNKHFEDTPKDS